MDGAALRPQLHRLKRHKKTAEKCNLTHVKFKRGTKIRMGYTTIARAKEQGSIVVTGNKELERNLGSWLTLSPFAKVAKLVA